MIKYKLICKNCDLLFDSWFASSDEFEKLKKRSFLTCHLCNSKKIEKSLMAPKMINKLKSKQNEQNNIKFKKIRKKIKEYQNFIEKNFENVGANFAYEARSIHYKDKKKDKVFMALHPRRNQRIKRRRYKCRVNSMARR